jgi:hypothetical protein
LFIGTVEDVEVVVINAVTDKDIGDKFQDRGFSDTSLPKKKDGIWCFRLVVGCLNDPLFERYYVTMEHGQYYCIKDVVVSYLIVGVSSSSSSSSTALDMWLDGPSPLDGPPKSVIVRDPECCGKPNCLGLVGTEVDIGAVQGTIWEAVAARTPKRTSLQAG